MNIWYTSWLGNGNQPPHMHVERSFSPREPVNSFENCWSWMSCSAIWHRKLPQFSNLMLWTLNMKETGPRKVTISEDIIASIFRVELSLISSATLETFYRITRRYISEQVIVIPTWNPSRTSQRCSCKWVHAICKLVSLKEREGACGMIM